jgi:hypothetical protein
MARYTTRQVFEIREDHFNSVESWIRAAERSGQNIRYGLNVFAMLAARTDQAFSQQMSRGPIDPQERNPGAAWKLPVRRITGKYYRGWKVKRLAPAVWIVYNDTREAYFIEYGINHIGSSYVSGRGGARYAKNSRRVRRPVRKLALIKTLRAMDRSQAGHRVWEVIWSPFRGPRYEGSRGAPGTAGDFVQSVQGMRFI